MKQVMSSILLLFLLNLVLTVTTAQSEGNCPVVPGLPGRDGRDGAPGRDGPPGPPGTFSYSELIAISGELREQMQTIYKDLLAEELMKRVKNFNCSQDLGRNHSTPAMSCLHIYQCEQSPPSGLYWIGENETTSCTPREGPLLYHKLMTSQWIQDNAAISGLVSANSTVMHFETGTTDARLLRIPIIQRGQVPEEDIVVYIKVYLHDPPTSDSDPLFGISDERIFNGIYVSDGENYPNNACWFHSSGSGPNLTNTTFSGTCGGIPITYTTYPNEVTLTFYPSEQLGTFHIIPDGGYTTVGSFTKKLDLTQGLFFEMYGDQATEQYLLQYIQIEVKLN